MSDILSISIYLIHINFQNTSVTIGNETVISRRINDNPNLSFYTTIYASSLGVMIVTTVFRAFVFMKVGYIYL